MEKGNDEGAGAAEQPGQPTGGSQADPGASQANPGGSQADQSGPTRERDPWAGTPDLGETKLPDGTTLRRDAKGNMHRTDAAGNEHIWEDGTWVREYDRQQTAGSEGWGDPASDWREAWTGKPWPESWKDVPRSGSTRVPGGSLTRDQAGGYTFGGDKGQQFTWNEQSGGWVDSKTGHPVPDAVAPPDAVDGWLRGAEADAAYRANPDQPRTYQAQSDSEGPIRP